MADTKAPPSRPGLDRKTTRKTEDKRKQALDSGIRITLLGETYTVRTGDIKPAVARELRRETGLSWQSLADQFGTDPDVDTFGTFAWFARRLEGEDVDLDDFDFSYDDVANGGVKIEVLDGGKVVKTGEVKGEADDDPEG